MASCFRAYMLIWLFLGALWYPSSDRFVIPQNVSLPGCPSTCGNVTIPYPFGIGTACAREGLQLRCDHSFSPPKTFLHPGNEEVLWLSLEGHAQVLYFVGEDCYSKNGRRSATITGSVFNGSIPYTFSNLHNKFTAIGCDTEAYIVGRSPKSYMSGCTAICNQLDDVINGSCSGIGCCQTAIPKGLREYLIEVSSFSNHSRVRNFNPCSYVFLVDQDWFTFNVADITEKSAYGRGKTFDRVPAVLDWAAGSEECAVAIKDKDRYACRSEHSECYDSRSGAAGYLCNCASGYEGNPYLVGGCQGC